MTNLLAAVRAHQRVGIAKVCGVRSVAGYTAAVNAQAEMIGLNFVPGARRAVSPVVARSLTGGAAKAGGRRAPDRVGVFRDQSLDAIEQIAEEAGLDWIQLHGDEPSSFAAQLRGHFGVIKALRATDANLAEQIEDWRDADLLLLDGSVPGSGTPWDVDLIGRVKIDRPWLLAGGLNAINVASLLLATGASGADVASGVERDGEQDAALILSFCAQAHGALALRKQ